MAISASDRVHPRGSPSNEQPNEQHRGRQRVAILGGTFDPIHFGHLKPAQEIVTALQLDALVLVPCHNPPHRGAPVASINQRLTMATIAADSSPNVCVNDIEAKSDKVSYTIDTLKSLRTEYGANASLSFVMGLDSLLAIHQWREWRQLLRYTHIIVTLRPGYDLAQLCSATTTWLQQHRTQQEMDIRDNAHGRVYVLESPTRVDVSATRLREQLAQGLRPEQWMPAAVVDYCEQHQLYQNH